MNHLQQNIHAIIRPGDEGGYVAECLEISVVTQGKTLDQISHNLIEAVSLHLEGENPADFCKRSSVTFSELAEDFDD
ncbi:UNVERIFIED_CONTAM: hypothetical protein BEN50_18540 [Euhalothece sp. KZN 001]